MRQFKFILTKEMVANGVTQELCFNLSCGMKLPSNDLEKDLLNAINNIKIRGGTFKILNLPSVAQMD